MSIKVCSLNIFRIFAITKITNNLIMQYKLKLAIVAMCLPAVAFAQDDKKQAQTAKSMDESAFTFSEAQLGEDADASSNVTILNSNSNVYASQVGYLFSPVFFDYRALNPRYNDVYINGASMNDMESGQFRFSNLGGLNQQTRNVDFALPFESNNFTMPAMGGSNNYDLRAGSMPAGNYASLGAANRSYTFRGMYSYASGFNNKGWAFAGALTYRWADRGYVEGTFYNSLSYFLGVQKKWTNGHSLSFSTWGNPTERASQGAATDENYWLANDRFYNPYWGYQDGKVRNSRVINDFSPTALLTWDWNINDNAKLTTTLLGKYSIYKSTKLNYNNANNPQPDYWKNLPSSYYDVWDDGDGLGRTDQNLADWNTAYNYWTASKANRQINWNRLYYSNEQASKQGVDAIYFEQAKHDNDLTFNLASTLTMNLGKDQVWNAGLLMGTSNSHHFQTMDDMLGATTFHNINTYALGTYDASSDYIQYDLNTEGPDKKGKVIGIGDVFGFDYNIYVNKATAWTNYAANVGRLHFMVAAKIGGTNMERNGRMRNGMFANSSYGKSGFASFLDGGGKASVSFDTGVAGVLSLGAGYQWNAPMASVAFASPELNNDFVNNLKDERVFSGEFSYQYQNAWLHANLNAYYNRINNATEWQNFYFDDVNSFSYVSMTGINKENYGLELGLDFKLTSFLNLQAIGTIGDAKNTNNANVRYLNSTSARYVDDIVYNKGMREGGTPLTAASLGLSFHKGGWYIDLNGNYYDRIYLFYSPDMRYGSSLTVSGRTDNEGNPTSIPEQTKGHGGFMLDGSIGKSIYLKHGSLNFNFMITNILNNRNIVSGGYEQSRSDYTVNAAGTLNNNRVYKFSRNPKKYYAYGTNGMLQVSYRF